MVSLLGAGAVAPLSVVKASVSCVMAQFKGIMTFFIVLILFLCSFDVDFDSSVIISSGFNIL